jgi:hypothetical protein
LAQHIFWNGDADEFSAEACRIGELAVVGTDENIDPETGWAR